MKRKSKSRKHDYEIAYPEQCAEFRKIIEAQYQLFLDKGKEYGVNNVRAMGPLGLSLRMFEKVIRVLNLLGWNPWKGEFTKAINNPKFDSIQNECADISNIAVISLIVARGKWAK